MQFFWNKNKNVYVVYRDILGSIDVFVTKNRKKAVKKAKEWREWGYYVEVFEKELK